MKLSWRDMVTTLMALGAGILVYAALQDYSWWLVDSWRGLVAALAVIGTAVYIIAGGEYNSRSWFDRLEVALGVVAVGFVVAGLIVSSKVLALIVAGTMAATWLVATARRVRRSILHLPTTHGHVHAH